MKVGDLVRIKQGSRKGKLALISRIEGKDRWKIQYDIRVIPIGCGDWFGYYRRDLEVISEGG